jgi:hypothetical protein
MEKGEYDIKFVLPTACIIYVGETEEATKA